MDVNKLNSILEEYSKDLTSSEVIERVSKALEYVQGLKASDFIREELGNPFNFRDAEFGIRKVIEFCRSINSTVGFLSLQPYSQISYTDSQLRTFLQFLERIVKFDAIQNAEGMEPVHYRRYIIDNINSFYDPFRTQIDLIYNESLRHKIDTSKEFIELNNLNKKYKEQINEIDKAYEKVREQFELNKQREVYLEKLTKSISELSGDAGIIKEASHFDNLVFIYKRNSIISIIALISFLVLTIIWGLYIYSTLLNNDYLSFLSNVSDELRVYAYVQFVLTKIFVTTLLFFTLYLCVSSYKNNMHNYVLNKHRATALKTYKVMVGAADSQENRMIILHQAASCIYSIVDSGFNNKDSQSSVSVPVSVPIDASLRG